MTNRLGPLISSSIALEFRRRRLDGRDVNRLSASVGEAAGAYLSIPNRVLCTLSGLSGITGTFTSTAVAGLSAELLTSLMVMNTSQLKGRDTATLLGCISAGLVRALQTMVLTGSALGIGPGSGAGKFSYIDSTEFSGLLSMQFRRNGLQGRDAEKLVNGISKGLVQHLRTSVTFPALCAGAVVPAPPLSPVPVAGVVSAYSEIK